MAHPDWAELLKLPLAERIQLIEDLWDSIAANAERLPLSEYHREELARRRAALHDDQGRVVPWEPVRDRHWSEE